MEASDIKTGMRVKTTAHLGDTLGMLIAQKHLDARQPNEQGVITGYVPGHGGDVWWVSHNNGTTGAYVYNEFNPA